MAAAEPTKTRALKTGEVYEHRPEIEDASLRFKLMEEEVKAMIASVPEYTTFSTGAQRAFMVPIVSKWNLIVRKKTTRKH